MTKPAGFQILAVTVLAAFLASPLSANEAAPDFVGKAAPLFRTADPDGNPVALEGLLRENRTVLLNFWGLRCASCIEEIPHLNEFHRKYEGAGLKILGVNVDGVAGPKVKEQMEKMGLKMLYPWIPDPEFKVIESFRMSAAPLNVIINSSGMVTFYHEGFFEGDEAMLEAEITKAMTEARGRK